jgi:DUF4097 and DUF4098 domain-containing protein YvlB
VAAAVSAYADTTVDVSPDARLWLRNLGGMVNVTTWDKNSVKLETTPRTRGAVHIAQRGPSLFIESTHGPHADAVSRYSVTVPSWMSVALVSPEASARVHGLKGDLVVRTVNGEVVVTDNEGSVSVSSVQGPIRVARARGRLDVSTVNGPIVLSDVDGSVIAETVNGPIELARVNADSVEASTVNGLVRFDGSFLKGGWYHLTTHQGDIAVDLPHEPDAQVYVATYSGDFSSDFPVTATRARHGKGLQFTLGEGRAKLQLESFRGRIRLSRVGHSRTPAMPVYEWHWSDNPPTPPNDDEEDKK